MIRIISVADDRNSRCHRCGYKDREGLRFRDGRWWCPRHDQLDKLGIDEAKVDVVDMSLKRQSQIVVPRIVVSPTRPPGNALPLGQLKKGA